MKARAYASPLRARQAEQTRSQILDALVEELAHGGEEAAMPLVAERAGVSLRTVYHHFPNREAQIAALAERVEERLGVDEEPRTAAELPAYAARRAAKFFEHEALIRAQLAPGLATAVRARRRKKREAAIETCVRQTGAPEPDVRRVTALLRHLIGADIQVALIDRQGLPAAEIPATIEWAVAALLDALPRR